MNKPDNAYQNKVLELDNEMLDLRLDPNVQALVDQLLVNLQANQQQLDQEVRQHLRDHLAAKLQNQQAAQDLLLKDLLLKDRAEANHLTVIKNKY